MEKMSQKDLLTLMAAANSQHENFRPLNGFSSDPTYPIWRVEPGKTFIAYVPHYKNEIGTGTVVDYTTPDGETRERFNPDMPIIHRVAGLNTYRDTAGNEQPLHENVRCMNGLVLPSLGFEAGIMCPLCEEAPNNTGLISSLVKKETGRDDLSSEEWRKAAANYDSYRYLRGIRKEVEKDTEYVFPVGIVPMDASGTRPVVKDPKDNSSTLKMYWFVASSNMWGKFKSTNPFAQGSDFNPAGHCYILRYPDASKRDAGRELSITEVKQGDGLPEEFFTLIKDHFDKECANKDHPWDREAMLDKVADCKMRTYKELREMADRIEVKIVNARLMFIEGGTGAANPPRAVAPGAVPAIAGVVSGGGISTGAQTAGVPTDVQLTNMFANTDDLDAGQQGTPQGAQAPAQAARPAVNDPFGDAGDLSI